MPPHVLPFIAAAVAMTAAPGPMVIYIVTRSVERGYKDGLAAVLGISAATMVYVLVTAVGITALLLSSRLLFYGLRSAGAAYLIVLGVRIFRDSRRRTFNVGEPVHDNSESSVVEGFFVNLLNPNTPLFLSALLPQFVAQDRPGPPQLLVLGVLFVVLGAATDSAWAVAAGSAGDWLTRRTDARNWFGYVAAVVLIGLGAATTVATVRQM